MVVEAERVGRVETTAGRRGVVLVVASLASFMVALDLLIVTTALSEIRVDLDVTSAELQWTVTAYGVAFAGLLMTGTTLGDRFGRRRMMIVGLVVFAAGSAGAAMAGSLEALVVARVVQGVGGAVIVPVGLTIVATAYPPARRASAIGVLEAITGLAVVAGPVLGGLIAERISWEWVFWINVPVATAAVPLVWLFVVESHGARRPVDVVGLVLVSGSASAFAWALARGDEAGWTSAETTMVLSAAIGALIAFVWWERRSAAPMLPPRFFASRSFTAGVIAAFLLAGSLYGAVFFMAQFIGAAMQVGALGAGLRLVPWTVTLLLVAPLAGALADRIGYRRVLVVGLVLQTVGLVWLALVAGAGLSYAVMLAPLVVSGVGTSAALPVTQAAIVAAVADEEIGTAAGVNNMLQELGGAMGVAVGVAVFGAVGGYAAAGDVADGFAAAMWVAAAFAAAGSCAALMLPSRSAS